MKLDHDKLKVLLFQLKHNTIKSDNLLNLYSLLDIAKNEVQDRIIHDNMFNLRRNLHAEDDFEIEDTATESVDLADTTTILYSDIEAQINGTD